MDCCGRMWISSIYRVSLRCQPRDIDADFPHFCGVCIEVIHIPTLAKTLLSAVLCISMWIIPQVVPELRTELVRVIHRVVHKCGQLGPHHASIIANGPRKTSKNRNPSFATSHPILAHTKNRASDHRIRISSIQQSGTRFISPHQRAKHPASPLNASATSRNCSHRTMRRSRSTRPAWPRHIRRCGAAGFCHATRVIRKPAARRTIRRR